MENLTKTQEHQPLGTYKPTAIDEAKKQADMLIESIEDGWYAIRPNKDIPEEYMFEGKIYNMRYCVFKKLDKNYKILPNF
jgi:hypothetical protein